MFAIHQGFKRIITLRYTKADGTPGEVEGVPVWSIVPPETSVLTPAPDGMSAEIAWAGSGDSFRCLVTI